MFKEKADGQLRDREKRLVHHAQNTKDFIILGMVSSNKELFLFDRHVSMS